MEGDPKNIIPFPTNDTEWTKWGDRTEGMLHDANLPEIPTNIHGIKNGTVIELKNQFRVVNIQ